MHTNIIIEWTAGRVVKNCPNIAGTPFTSSLYSKPIPGALTVLILLQKIVEKNISNHCNNVGNKQDMPEWARHVMLESKHFDCVYTQTQLYKENIQ